MVYTEKICKCDICGKVILESESGHERWPTNITLGYNSEGPYKDIKYDDVCDECEEAILKVINTRKGIHPLNQFFMDKLKKI